MKKTVFIGSVVSSKVALETLIKNDVHIDLICGLDETASHNVSDYYPIHEIAKAEGIPFITFDKVQSMDVKNSIQALNPDFIFVVGLSQLIPEEILALANDYVIGFHPTALPKFRGRAAIPWQILLDVTESKVSLFKLDQGMDSGDIIKQYPYKIEKTDYAEDVYNSVCDALSHALSESISDIYNQTACASKQDDEEATYLLVRRPEDGKIDWNQSVYDIHKLIRATSHPYPGAYAMYEESKVIIWRARIIKQHPYTGIPGQIAVIDEDIHVVTKDGILVIEEFSLTKESTTFTIGRKFK